MKSILILLAMSLPPSLVARADAPQALSNPPVDSSAEKLPLWKTIDESLFWAKAEIRYQSEAAQHYGDLDLRWKWAAILFGLAAFACPLILRPGRNRLVETAWYMVGFFSLCAALWSAFAGYGELQNRHAVLAEHWLLLADTWSAIEADYKSLPLDELKQKVERATIAQTTTKTAEPIDTMMPEWQCAWIEEARVQGRKITGVSEPPSGKAKVVFLSIIGTIIVVLTFFALYRRLGGNTLGGASA